MRIVRFFVRKKVETFKPIVRTSKKVAMFGELYSIKIVDGSRNRAKIFEDHVEISLQPVTKFNFETFLDSWYRRQAKKAFYDAVDKWMPEFERLEYEIPYPKLKIYNNMRRVWGRCYYTRGVITVNLRLFSMPKDCIDYIILHELTHFVAHDHGMLFKAILDKIDPNWRTKEALLRKLETNLKW